MCNFESESRLQNLTAVMTTTAPALSVIKTRQAVQTSIKPSKCPVCVVMSVVLYINLYFAMYTAAPTLQYKKNTIHTIQCSIKLHKASKRARDIKFIYKIYLSRFAVRQNAWKVEYAFSARIHTHWGVMTALLGIQSTDLCRSANPNKCT